MNGPDCPVHGTPMGWVSTFNEWEFVCVACDRRYNRDLEPMPPVSDRRPWDTGLLAVGRREAQAMPWRSWGIDRLRE